MKNLKHHFKKNYLIYLAFIAIVAIFLSPLAFTEKFTIDEDSQKIEIKLEEPTIDFSVKYKTINLLHKEDNSIETVELDDYLVNVVAAEMPVSYEMEALKAQATVARTYTLYQILNGKKHENADICDSSTCCQAWISKEKRYEAWGENQDANWNKIREAVYLTAGDIITYQGNLIDAFFHSNSGGITEIPANVWGGTNYPYLQVVETNGEDNYSQYYSEREYSKNELENKMREYYTDFIIDWSASDCIVILEYTESSRIKTIKIGNKNVSGVEARKIFELKSSNFTVEQSENKIKFKVKGYGHRSRIKSNRK